MKKILYITNCSSGIFEQYSIWCASRYCSSKGFIKIPQVGLNFSHFLIEIGYEVDVLLNAYPKIQPHEAKQMHPRSKILETAEIKDFFAKLCSGTSTEALREFAYPNTWCLPGLSEVINFNKYHMVILDSNTEIISFNKKKWYQIFHAHKSNSSFDILSKCVDMHEVIRWIDSPSHDKYVYQSMGNNKLFHNTDLIKEYIAPNINKLDNVFLRTPQPSAINYDKDPISILSNHASADYSLLLDCIFSKIEGSNFRYKLDEFISEDFFERLPGVVASHKSKKLEVEKLFKNTYSAAFLAIKNLSKAKKDRFFEDRMEISKNKISPLDSVSINNFSDYYFGFFRFTNKAYASASDLVDSLLS